MRDTFGGFYRPTDGEFAELWRTSVFVLDANVLLSLYRLPFATARDVEAVLAHLAAAGRLWVPHQAALEYQRNRQRVIEERAEKYRHARGQLQTAWDAVKTLLGETDPAVAGEIGPTQHNLEGSLGQIFEKLDKAGQAWLDLVDGDAIRDRLDGVLEGRVGPQYGDGQLESVYGRARSRCALRVPPGYADAHKQKRGGVTGDDLTQYGDVVLWFQVLDYAASVKKPIVLLTEEKKEDWWFKLQDGRTAGPRPELIQEMRSEGGVGFYMYSIELFMKHAEEHLGLTVREGVVEEIRRFEAREKADLVGRSLLELAAAERLRELLDTTERLEREAVQAASSAVSFYDTRTQDGFLSALASYESKAREEALRAAGLYDTATAEALRSASDYFQGQANQARFSAAAEAATPGEVPGGREPPAQADDARSDAGGPADGESDDGE